MKFSTTSFPLLAIQKEILMEKFIWCKENRSAYSSVHHACSSFGAFVLEFDLDFAGANSN